MIFCMQLVVFLIILSGLKIINLYTLCIHET